MADIKPTYEDFLAAVDPQHHDYINALNAYMLDNGCTLKIQTAGGVKLSTGERGGGYVVSYQYGRGKRVVLNFVFRKSGLVVRIYGDNTAQYAEFLETLPQSMVNCIEKSASTCKTCNSRCPKGYEFSINDKTYNKCRYGCFMFPIDDISAPFIRAFTAHELTARQAGQAG